MHDRLRLSVAALAFCVAFLAASSVSAEEKLASVTLQITGMT
ncbi:MAG TPA: hypothetical protein VEK08_12490 [Planctomycetota bacterium]|nr:hypothetical protein [Planctomycetota bacterium]